MGGAPIVDERAPKELRSIDKRARDEVQTWMMANMYQEGAASISSVAKVIKPTFDQ